MGENTVGGTVHSGSMRVETVAESFHSGAFQRGNALQTTTHKPSFSGMIT